MARLHETVGALGRRQDECVRKHRYPTHAEAEHAAKYLRQKTGDPVHIYKCACCAGWHVGKTGRNELRSFKPRAPKPPGPTVASELAFWEDELARFDLR